jgi:hypothetical protein
VPHRVDVGAAAFVRLSGGLADMMSFMSARPNLHRLMPLS